MTNSKPNKHHLSEELQQMGYVFAANGLCFCRSIRSPQLSCGTNPANHCGGSIKASTKLHVCWPQRVNSTRDVLVLRPKEGTSSQSQTLTIRPTPSAIRSITLKKLHDSPLTQPKISFRNKPKSTIFPNSRHQFKMKAQLHLHLPRNQNNFRSMNWV